MKRNVQNTETHTKKHILPAVIIGIALLLGILALIGNIMMYVQMNSAMKWKDMGAVTQADQERYAEYIMMPPLSDTIRHAAICGIRDPAYRIETDVYPSLEELYAVLPFENDQDREQALQTVIAPLSELPEELSDEDDAAAVYYADFLPVTEEDANGKVLAYYYFHDNYIVQNADGYRFVFIVQTT